jgi:hypothetical protein
VNCREAGVAESDGKIMTIRSGVCLASVTIREARSPLDTLRYLITGPGSIGFRRSAEQSFSQCSLVRMPGPDGQGGRGHQAVLDLGNQALLRKTSAATQPDPSGDRLDSSGNRVMHGAEEFRPILDDSFIDIEGCTVVTSVNLGAKQDEQGFTSFGLHPFHHHGYIF